MMISPDSFVSQYENAGYFDLLKLKNEYVQKISEFEQEFDMKEQKCDVHPGTDVRYQWNLEVLGKIMVMLKEAFNREFECGE